MKKREADVESIWRVVVCVKEKKDEVRRKWKRQVKKKCGEVVLCGAGRARESLVVKFNVKCPPICRVVASVVLVRFSAVGTCAKSVDCVHKKIRSERNSYVCM